MNTVSELLSTLKHNPALLDAITLLVSLATTPHHGLYRDQEAELLRAARAVSCAAQEVALSERSTPGPKNLIHQGKRFERTSRAPRTYTSLDGPVRVTRDLYICRQDGDTLCPFELEVGIVESTLTPAAARLEMMSAACDDFRTCQALHRASFVLQRSKSAMQRDMTALAQPLSGQGDVLEEVRRAHLPELDRVHAISVSVDRTGLPFEEPRKRGPGRPKKGAPKKPCEVVHRQVYCASLTLHDARGEALSTQRFAGLPEQGAQVVEDARACLRQLVTSYPSALLVQLCDGAEEMQNKGAQILEGYEVSEQLVDVWHAAKYVHQAFGAAGHTQKYCRELVRRLIENKTGLEEILMRINTIRVDHQLEAVEEARRYLTNHKARMNYARAREKGLPIGSGNVEATCKCVVAVRFKRAGARWKKKDASTLLKVRSWLTSSEQVWKPICDAFLDTYVKPIAA